MNLAFHKHYEFPQIARSILRKWTHHFLLVPHSARRFSLGRTFTTLIGINDILISFFFTPLPLSLSTSCNATHLFSFSSVINTAVGRIGHYGAPSGARPWSFFSPVQHGSALPASLRRGIERSIKVYLSICQLQWAVWWALIGQAFLCFSSWLGYYSSSATQLIKQFRERKRKDHVQGNERIIVIIITTQMYFIIFISKISSNILSLTAVAPFFAESVKCPEIKYIIFPSSLPQKRRGLHHRSQPD